MTQSKIQSFRNAHQKFAEALKWINDHKEELLADQNRYSRIRQKFEDNYEVPLRLAFEALDPSDQDRFATLYYLRQEGAEKDLDDVYKVIKEFNGKVVSIKHIRKDQK